jgi:hypothetical protein
MSASRKTRVAERVPEESIPKNEIATGQAAKQSPHRKDLESQHQKHETMQGSTKNQTKQKCKGKPIAQRIRQAKHKSSDKGKTTSRQRGQPPIGGSDYENFE